MTEIKVMQTDGSAATVKMSKLTEGIGIVFSGVLTMLEALDAGSASKFVETLNAVKDAETPSSAEGETKNEGGNASDRSETSDTDASDVDVDAVADDAVTEEPTKKTKASKKKPEEKQASTLSQDDVTKVIVQKIKKDRGNSAKVESILKTYGVAKVSELPVEKYEAFITDIAQL